jgi:exopolysaccharide biosynthesis polyprenyl glycosylphosphotransferase
MFEKQHTLWTRLNKVLDTGLFCVALTLAYFVRSKVPISWLTRVDEFSGYRTLYLLVILLAPIILATQGFYARPLIPARSHTVWSLLKGCLLLVVSLILGLFLFKLQFARAVVILFGVMSFALIVAKEELLRRIYKNKYAQDQFTRRIIVVGDREVSGPICARIRETALSQLEIVDEFDLGTQLLAQLIDCLHRHSVNTVVFCAQLQQFALVEEAIRACEQEGVEALLVADFFDVKISQVSFDHFFGFPTLIYSTIPAADFRIVTKRIIDLVGSTVLTILALPLFAIIAAAIKLSSRGPILFLQQRAGLNGRPFTMLKFRSMSIDAEARKSELYDRNEMLGPVFKVTNDPRVTPVGKFLRRFSLDELPQFINVLRGEMSLVGPRPLPLEEVRQFDDRCHRRRLSVKPGLTCLWQISGRNQITSFEEWVQLDLKYIDNWSLWLDFKILFRTGPVIVFGRGAK